VDRRDFYVRGYVRDEQLLTHLLEGLDAAYLGSDSSDSQSAE